MWVIVFTSLYLQLTNCLVAQPNVVTDSIVKTTKNYAYILREMCKKIYYPFVNKLSYHIHYVIIDASLQFGLLSSVNIFIQQQFQNFEA